MALFGSNEQDYLVLHLGGGSVHGLSQMQVLIFLEELAGIPTAWMFDMIAGDSFGSVPAAALNIPEKPGSKIPRFSAKRTSEVAEEVLKKTFNPFREEYHKDMVKLEIKIKALEEALNAIKDLKKAENPLTKKFMGTIAAMTVAPVLEKHLKSLKEQTGDVFFSFEHVAKALDRNFTFTNGQHVKLGQTITGFHSEAFNLDRIEPKTHSYIPPIGGWKGHLSDKDITLADISMRSMSAQTYFKPYKSRHTGEHFDDIAHHNTMASVMNSLRRKFTNAAESKQLHTKLNRKGLSIGVGTVVPDIDPKRMGELLILDRLDSEQGAPLIQIPVIYNTSKAIRDMEEELGPENVAFIEKILDPRLVKNKLRYRQILREFPNANKEILRNTLEYEASRIPAYNMIDARPETIEKIKEVGLMMVYENTEELVEFAKRGLERAYRHKLIDKTQLSERLEKINNTYPHLQERKHSKPKNLLDFLRFGGSFPQFGFGYQQELNNVCDEQDNDQHHETRRWDEPDAPQINM